ncbi:putative quinol monooxygenase [Desulfosporosinus sp. PR]|uniref:putative quinol monooxygenase n=1 Tax=Candidatus Desulfosporosinus nitrosoreducens TaxID=3401928 RepID=UPI0027FA7FDB|nr:putative quinol monooxygenase [Desulfosporosinus sp. PR]MDQ7092844.1 putative quinol monooxygenase [Desulfosporosinus sp. PR]
MITYIATLKAFPGKEKELTAFCAELAKQVRNEDGCLMCLSHVVANDPGTIVFFEKYKDEAAHQAHMQAGYMQEGFEKLKELAMDDNVVFLSEL